MTEHQNLEWKETWRDEYLRWICGFDNAQGGTLIIGKSDRGGLVGVKEVKKLLEDLPNKVRDTFGIMVDVNRKREAGVDLVEIVVEPYPTPIRYKGEYHYRSGSTKQELNGAALDQFRLRRPQWHPTPVKTPVEMRVEPPFSVEISVEIAQAPGGYRSGDAGRTTQETAQETTQEPALEGGLLRDPTLGRPKDGGDVGARWY